MEELNSQPLDREARPSIWMSGFLGLRRKARQRRWYKTNTGRPRIGQVLFPPNTHAAKGRFNDEKNF